MTLTNVAERLGVRHSALYRHVDGADHLARLVADRLVETMPAPAPSTQWRAYLRNVSTAIYDMCDAHPGAAELIYSHVWPPPRHLILFTIDVTRHLVSLGFPSDLAILACDIVADFTVDATFRLDRLAELSGTWGGFTDALTAEDAELAEEVRVFDEHMTVSGEDWMRSKLEIVLDGIGTRLAD